jgi:hypothetical protein
LSLSPLALHTGPRPCHWSPCIKLILVMLHVLLCQNNTDVSIGIILSSALREYCDALRCETLLIPFDSGYVAFRVGEPTVLLLLDWRCVTHYFPVLAMLTMSLGFDDRIYLKYETIPDRAVLPLTFLVGSLLMCNLLLLHYKVYCMFSFLSSKPKVL